MTNIRYHRVENENVKKWYIDKNYWPGTISGKTGWQFANKK